MSRPPAITDPDAPRPSFSIAALVLDLDGTCLDADDQSLHPRVREAVRDVARRLPVVIATGRMYRSAQPWARELGVDTPLVCYQGAVVKAQSGEVLLDDGLPPATALRALDVARAHGWHFQAYIDDELICEQDRPEAHLYARIARVPIEYVPDLVPLLQRASSAKVICVIDDAEEVKRCMAAMSQALGASARVTQSLPPFVEIVSPQVSKAVACELVCRRLGVSLAQAVAIGDAPNDVEVLDACGFAIAVASAPPEVLEHAVVTCAPPRLAGVADALTALGLIRGER